MRPNRSSQTRSTDTVIIYILRRMRIPLIALISVFAISMIGLVLIPGINDQGEPWQMSFFEAFYVVSYTATTIGFGEIPYAFTAAQRFWVSIMIYPSVIAWLYSFGTILTLMQDPTFKQALTESAYSRHVRRIKTPFYLICGYGDTGQILVRKLTDQHQQSVVIDIAQEAINELKIEDLSLFVPALGADASQAAHLIKAGIMHPNCVAIAAVTDDDKANLKIAIASKLLNPDIQVACRAETTAIESNMASFGTDYIVNPYNIFASHLIRSLLFPVQFTLQQMLTDCFFGNRGNLNRYSDGRWIICGYGRLGHAIRREFDAHRIRYTIIELSPNTELPEETVIGTSTEAGPLLEAGIGDAVGIIATLDDDADNLSTIMTARELNPELCFISKQNLRANDLLFKAANVHMIMQNNSIVSNKIITSLSIPMLGTFLEKTYAEPASSSQKVIDRISAINDEQSVQIWQLRIDADQAPALHQAIKRGETVRLDHLTRDAWHPEIEIPAIPLLIQQGSRETFLPDPTHTIGINDTILFCGANLPALDSLLFQDGALEHMMSTIAA